MAARQRGMTDPQIEKATGIRASTFHRWRAGKVAPTVDKVRQFCAGLGISATEALGALGVSATDMPASPPMDEDVQKLLNLLADPKTPATTKDQIRAMMRALAAMADALPPKKTTRRKVG